MSSPLHSTYLNLVHSTNENNYSPFITKLNVRISEDNVSETLVGFTVNALPCDNYSSRRD